MKRLYLARHAKSSWEEEWLDDFERPLNERGKRDAPMMGEVLKDLGVKPDVLVTSPAARAVATARILARILEYPLEKIRYRERLYEAGNRDFVDAIATLDDEHESAMLIGHNPTLTSVANMLTGAGIENVPTAGVVGIGFDEDSWIPASEQGGRLLFFEYPKKHRDTD